MAALAVNGGLKVKTEAYMESKPVKETKALVSELCRQFYTLGWVSGTGGSITIKVHDDSIPKPQQIILMSPSGTLASLFFHGFLFFVFLDCFLLNVVFDQVGISVLCFFAYALVDICVLLIDCLCQALKLLVLMAA